MVHDKLNLPQNEEEALCSYHQRIHIYADKSYCNSIAGTVSGLLCSVYSYRGALHNA